MNDTEKLALILLTRREHSAHELVQKLKKKGHDFATSMEVVRKFQDLGYQSDLRFAENVYQTRVRRGYGPQRIQQELCAAKLDDDLIQQVLASDPGDWVERARDVWHKKYSNHHGCSLVEIQKQQQFLLYRGFYMETIIKMLRENES